MIMCPNNDTVCDQCEMKEECDNYTEDKLRKKLEEYSKK